MAEPDSSAPMAGAFVDLSPWWKLEVSGPDARSWLNDLVSADVGPSEPGDARRSLLLSPTGRIRAEFTVVRRNEGFVLLQDPRQARFVGELLDPYVLSSAVELADRTRHLALFSLPAVAEPPPVVGGAVPSSPSCLGAGMDLMAGAAGGTELRSVLSARFREAGLDEAERWRILSGIPRFGVDAVEEDLPAEGGLQSAVAFDKGCYLGQEAVAKVRNLGHPRRILASLAADGPVGPGDAVFGPRGEAGRITSAAEHGGRWLALARLAWGAREGPFRAASGPALRWTGPVPSDDVSGPEGGQPALRHPGR